MSWYFHFQQKGGEDEWQIEMADDREAIIRSRRPAFVSVLDLTSVPDDNDWSKVKYRGPWYTDFDAESLDEACEQFKNFLGKLDAELGFDISQARLYATGGRGFHVEIPAECFMPKVPAAGTVWLPYIYRAMAEAIVVDTMDMRVYSGKRGRMWRTPNVRREGGTYKVMLTLEEALEITPESYGEIVSTQRAPVEQTPPSCNSRFAMLFERSRDKVITSMRGKKKRVEKANALLDPWKKAKLTPPTIESLMAGENIADGIGFQQLSMQLAIYATSVGMEMEDFVERCKGLCDGHVSDSRRYNTPSKRREELRRMYRYMDENSFYDFDTGPVARLVKPGVSVADLGVIDTEDHEDTPPPAATTTASADPDAEPGEEQAETSVATPAGDVHKGVRRGFFMNGDGMFKRSGDIVEPVCRAVLRKVIEMYDTEREEFIGYEFDIIAKGQRKRRAMLSSDAFASAVSMKKFFVGHQLSFQGGDPECMGLFDIMAEKAQRNGRVFTWPREGFAIVKSPSVDDPTPVKIYITKDSYLCSVDETDEAYFVMRYRPTQAESTYNIDIHKAPELDESMVEPLKDLFRFNRPDIVADLLGWFVACHYRSAYLYLFNQFPMLQVYGEAGAGKTQTVVMLSHLHWYNNDIKVGSAMSSTNFAVDSHASTSTSAPYIIDEYKPRELRSIKGRLEKLKDLFKASYIGGDIGNRGTLNKGPETNLSTIRSKATAPIVFMGEAIEMETAIIERSVSVNLTQASQRGHEEAFTRLHDDNAHVLSSVGRDLVQMGFALNLDAMRAEVRAIQADIVQRLGDLGDDTRKRAAPRMIFNRAIVIHGLRTLKAILARRFGNVFDETIDGLLNARTVNEDSKVTPMTSTSEISKVLNRIALLSRDRDAPHEMQVGKDYKVGDGWVEIRVERAYDQYRRYCAVIHDTPLFDSLDAFLHALTSYSPVVDRKCVGSDLREEGSTERVFKLDLRALTRENVQAFRDL